MLDVVFEFDDHCRAETNILVRWNYHLVLQKCSWTNHRCLSEILCDFTYGSYKSAYKNIIESLPIRSFFMPWSTFWMSVSKLASIVNSCSRILLNLRFISSRFNWILAVLLIMYCNFSGIQIRFTIHLRRGVPHLKFRGILITVSFIFHVCHFMVKSVM